jgi:excisionase family DNA binding protein
LKLSVRPGSTVASSCNPQAAVENTMENLLCSVSEASDALGLGRTKTYQLITEGKLLTVSIGRRRLIRTDSLRALAFGEAA